MRKRGNSQSASSTPTHSKTVSISNTSAQNYLHMLKQTSSAYKATKTALTTKPETISSLLRSTNLRTPPNKSESGLHSSLKSNIFTSFTPTASSQKQSSPPIAIDLRTMNFRENQKADSKMPSAPRNNSEPRLKNSVIKQLNLPQQKPQSGSFNLTEDSDKADDLFSSPQQSTDLQKEKIQPDSTKAASNSSEKNRDQALHTGVSLINSLELHGISKPSQFMQQKSAHSSTNELLNESFDTYKGYKNLSEEGDSRAEERCMNHPNKRAKYFTMSEDELQIRYNLCSKCAVALADKGAKVKEIINSEEELRKSEIEAFLIKLSHSRKHATSIIESMSIKKSDFIEFFNKQSEKAEAIASVLQKVIIEELNTMKKNFEIQKLKTLAAIESFEQQLRNGFKEVEEMQSDIERNFENIMKHIELAPFKKIIDSYYTRLYDIDQHLEGTRAQKLEVGKLSTVKSKNVQEFRLLTQSFFELRGLKTSILKRMEGDREDDTSPKTSAESSRQTNKSSLSFEIKDASESGSVFESNREPDRFSFACDQSAIVKATKLGDIKSPSSLMSDSDNPLKSQESPQTVSSRHAIGNKDKQSPFDIRMSIGDAGTMRRSSCPSVNEDRMATANFLDRDSVVPLNKGPEVKTANFLDRDSVVPLTKSAEKMKTSKNEGKQKTPYPSEEEEMDPPLYDPNLIESLVRDSMVRVTPNDATKTQKEEKTAGLLTVPEKRPLKNPFARKKSADSRQKNISKSQNNSFHKDEEEDSMPTGTMSRLEPHRSPYFKEMADK